MTISCRPIASSSSHRRSNQKNNCSSFSSTSGSPQKRSSLFNISRSSSTLLSHFFCLANFFRSINWLRFPHSFAHVFFAGRRCLGLVPVVLLRHLRAKAMCLPALRPIAAVIAADIGPALATVPPAAIVPAVIGVPGAHLRLLRRWQPLPGVLMSRLRPWLVRHRHSMPFFVISRIGKQSCLCSFMAGF